MSALCLLHLTILRSILVTVRNLLDEVDDALPQPGVLDLHECFDERRAVGGGEKIGHAGGPNIGSRINREVHGRIWERPEVRILRATRRRR